ncbi:hypothetical protein [Paenibacillus brasilensis]|uniref:Uncharacterized protein n=1 Tax=Paenibacillus brasilensis TaxID=128574 RepID=A0ABU0L7Q0_9BACL|nr:hypothetical protein [Paenibacillus brasilensis]MDQ0497301.1 hypothetical protein [Paenibacillus brasilensis]
MYGLHNDQEAAVFTVMFKEDASKGISLSQADRDKMSKLYEEISVQLEEMSNNGANSW